MAYKFNPFTKKPDYYESGSGSTTDDVARDNIVILAWKLAIASSLAYFKLEDGIVDEFEDETGVDTVNSTNESYNSTDDYYSPSAGTEVDNMEYASDALAQAAYVTNATYGSDVLTGGTPSVDSVFGVDYEADMAVDDNAGTWWASANTALPHWFKYDFGAGNSKKIERVTLKGYNETGICSKDFTVQGSNNDSDWTTLYTGQMTNDENVQTFTFNNSSFYRYYKINCTSVYNTYLSHTYASFKEIEMIDLSLQSYSESTIKEQGSYSFKGVGTITDSLNKTLTRTVSSPIDLSGINTLYFKIRSSRTGSNIKIGIHDSGGTTTETTPNITGANAWQTVTWDISGVSDTNKDAIDSIIITIVNADATNTFYIDAFSGPLSNMTLISNDVEAEAEPTETRFLALVEPVDSITINTDLKGYVSEDNGSNYDQVTLTDEGYFDSSKKILAGNVSITDRSDKTMRQKLTTHNNKDLKVHAWGMLWK
jgi:hypothetical protein